MSWVLDANPVDAKAIKKYHKQHPREVELCFANLTRLERILKQGVTLQQAMRCGFFSNEGADVYRIGQQRKGIKETRLYIFAQIVAGQLRY